MSKRRYTKEQKNGLLAQIADLKGLKFSNAEIAHRLDMKMGTVSAWYFLYIKDKRQGGNTNGI